MKKFGVVLFSFLLVVSAVSAATVDSVQKSITVDGDISDWSGVSSYSISEVDPDLSVPSSSSDFTGSFRSAWDGSYLYFLFDVTDDDFDVSGGNYVWDHDSVEIMIDGGNEKSTSYDNNDHKVIVRADGQDVVVWDGQENPASGDDVIVSSSQVSDGYFLEVGVRWSLLGGQSPADGVTYGFDAAVGDRDGGVLEHYLMWRLSSGHTFSASDWHSLSLSKVSTHSEYSLSSLDFTSSSTQTLDVSVSDTVIFDTGYYSLDGGGDWTAFSLSGSSSSGPWILSSASSSIGLNLADVNVSGDERVAFYACSWSSGWDCHGNNWQIRQVQVTLPEATSGPVCDNGILETGEECDGINFGGETCQTLGFDNGSLSCTSSCNIDTSGCYNNTETTAPSDDSPDSVQGDHEALLAIYQSTSGDSWTDNTGWGGDASTMSSWYGVTTDANGRVIELNLQDNNLVGTLPPEIGNLKELEVLKLKTNLLTGQIPDTIGDMTALRYLSLGGQLCELNLDDIGAWNSPNHRGCGEDGGKTFQQTNTFSGPLPESIGNLVNLELIEIRRQYLTGELPASIGNLVNLRGLFLNNQKSENPIGGLLPAELGNLKNLIWLHINGNAFSGDVPTTLDDMPEIRHVRLYNNQFTGPLPQFRSSRDMRYYNVGRNSFTGDFPHSLFDGNHSFLNMLDISYNKLQGTIPQTVPAPVYPDARPTYDRLSVINTMGGNMWEPGPVPEWIEKNPHTEIFGIGNSGFTGPFPMGILTTNKKVKAVRLWGNNFEGPLPDVPILTQNIHVLQFSGNNLTGEIPPAWESLTNSSPVSEFYISHNEFEGNLPRWILDLDLWRFRASDNKFVFKNILNIKEDLEAQSGLDQFTYAPQKPFGHAKTVTKNSGESFTIDFSDKSHSNDVYQWTKDGVALTGETSHTITIPSVSTSDAGEYKLEITNDLIPELGTLKSEPITLVVE